MVRRLILVAIIITICDYGFSQESLRIILKLDSVILSKDLRLIYLYDGVPILNGNKVMDLVDAASIDSIHLRNRPIFSCENEKLFDALLKIKSKDTINVGLKYILSHTDNWILANPLADLYVNGEKTRWDIGFSQLSTLDSSSIDKIEIEDPNRTGKCSYGKIYITIKSK